MINSNLIYLKLYAHFIKFERDKQWYTIYKYIIKKAILFMQIFLTVIFTLMLAPLLGGFIFGLNYLIMHTRIDRQGLITEGIILSLIPMLFTFSSMFACFELTILSAIFIILTLIDVLIYFVQIFLLERRH